MEPEPVDQVPEPSSSSAIDNSAGESHAGISRASGAFFFIFMLLPFYPAALKGSVVGQVGGRAAGQTSPINTLMSLIFHRSFSNLARTFIALKSRMSSIMEVLPHQICA